MAVRQSPVNALAPSCYNAAVEEQRGWHDPRMNILPSPDTRAAVLRHPFFLAGLAVVALLGLTAGVLVVADSIRGGDNKASPAVVVAPLNTATAAPAQKTASASGVTATTKATTTVRSAPGPRTTSLGTLPAHADLEIDGRTTDSKWLRFVYPPNSEYHGWVDASLVDIAGDPLTLVVATAEPAVVVEPPPEDRALLTSIASQPTPNPSGTSLPGTPGAKGTATGTAGKLPDLIVASPPTIAGGKLFVTVVNQGPGDAKGDLVVALFAADGVRLVGGATLPNFTLQAGRSIDVGTGYAVTEDQTLVLVVDPNGTIEETDNTNNRLTVAIALGDPPPTPGLFTTPDAAIIATLIAIATQTAEATPPP
jgi:hypothetical protein